MKCGNHITTTSCV